MPCGGSKIIPKEYLHEELNAWSEHTLRYIKKRRLEYHFINSHYWDGSCAGQRRADTFEKEFNFTKVDSAHLGED